MNATCSATYRKLVRSWGTATEYGYPACGATATKVRMVTRSSGHEGTYEWPVHFCDEHARATDAPIVEEPAEVVEVVEVVEVEAPKTSCTALAEPGNMHFMTVHCVECTAFRMAKMSPDTVEGWYHSGHFGQNEYEAYMHAWATSAVRHSAGGWAEEPTDPKVIEIVAAIRRHAGIPAPTVLAA
jgi:ferredoxin-like protein FixX